MKFGDPDNLHYGLPDKNALSNASAVVLRFRAWTILGDVVTHPTLFWTLNKERLHGRTQTVEFGKISKYPDLVKRYEAIRPSQIRAIVGLGLNPADTYAGGAYAWFKVSDNDVLIYPSGKNPMTFPTAPLNAGEGMIAKSGESPSGDWSFVSSFADFKPVDNPAALGRWLSDATSAADYAWARIGQGQARKTGTSRSQNIWLELKWPLDAIDKIQELYIQYENGTPPSPLEEADKTLAAENPGTYNDAGEWGSAYEDDLKGVAAVHDRQFMGLKANGRTIATFDPDIYGSIQSFKNDGKFFALSGKYDSRRTTSRHIVNKRGIRQTIGGFTEFDDVIQLDDGNIAADAILSAGEFRKQIVVRMVDREIPQGVFPSLSAARSAIENYNPGSGTFTGYERKFSVDKVQRIVLSPNMSVVSSETLWKIR